MQGHGFSASQIADIVRDLVTRTPLGAAMSSYDVVVSHLHLIYAGRPVEEFHCLFLDRKNMLIECRLMGVGTVDHVPVYPREVLKAALLLDASAIILSHNHPSGDPTPSATDIQMTNLVNDGCQAIGITLHDHVIIGNGRDYSLRAAGDF